MVEPDDDTKKARVGVELDNEIVHENAERVREPHLIESDDEEGHDLLARSSEM